MQYNNLNSLNTEIKTGLI